MDIQNLLKTCMNASAILALPHAFWMMAIKHTGLVNSSSSSSFAHLEVS